MYMNEAIERINNIKWDLVGKNISKSDAYYGCEFLRRLAKFFKDESIKPIKPVMTNIAKLLGDDGERINLSRYLNKDAMEFIGDRMFKFIFEHYLQLARYSDGNAAHHIVPWNDSRALEARTILDKFGIEYDSAANGVFLPYEVNEYVGVEAMHIGNHGKEYINEVTNRLKEVIKRNGQKADIIATLNEIRKNLLDGTLKLN